VLHLASTSHHSQCPFVQMIDTDVSHCHAHYLPPSRTAL
jgi:hypothetical protein